MGVGGEAARDYRVVLPVLLPLLPVEPLLLAPLLGEVVAPLLGEVVALAPPLLVLPLAPLELDLLKYASHSEREIWPSLLVSTDEKLGVAVLALAALPPEALDEALGRLDDPVPEPPEAALPLGEEAPLLMPLVLPDDELCPAATPDSANSAAAVAMLTNLRFNIGWISLGEVGRELRPSRMQDVCPGFSPRTPRSLSPSGATTRDASGNQWRT